MDSANRTDMVDICSASMENRGTRAFAMESDFDQLMAVALAVDVVKLAAMDHFLAEVSLAVAVVASIVTLEFVDTFCSVDCLNGTKELKI